MEIVKRRRGWATAVYFEGLKRKLPKTTKSHVLLCPEHKPDYHKLNLYATWIWPKPKRGSVGVNAFLSQTIKSYGPWITSNFMMPRPSISILMGETPAEWWKPSTPADLSKLAKHYGFLG